MKKKSKYIQKSKITVQRDFRLLQIVVCRIIGYFILGECIVIIFESIYLAIIKFYEYIGMVIIIFEAFSKYQNRYIRTINYRIRLQWLQIVHNLLVLPSLLDVCKSLLGIINVFGFRINQVRAKHIIGRLVRRGVVIFLIKIISSMILESYTAVIIEKTMKYYQVYQAAIIAVLFENSILFLLLTYFGWRVFKEIREKSLIKTSPDGFRMMEQLSAIQQQEKSIQKEELKNPTPDQAELEDKGSINISINENISPAMLKLKSSLSPSPGKYRSGKILDFLERKISHAKQSQKELSNGLSQEFNRKYNTEQMQQMSIDFGDQEDFSSARNPIDVEIQNHNFSNQIKFIS